MIIQLRSVTIPALAHACDVASKVIRNDSTESAEKINTFKYRMARNASKLEALWKACMMEQARVFTPDEKCRAYWDEQQAICERHATVDKDGVFILGPGSTPDLPRFQYTRKALKERNAELRTHTMKYWATVIKIKVGIRKRARILERIVPADLMMWDFADFPDRIAGGWAEALRPVLTNMPDDLPAKPDESEVGEDATPPSETGVLSSFFASLRKKLLSPSPDVPTVVGSIREDSETAQADKAA